MFGQLGDHNILVESRIKSQDNVEDGDQPTNHPAGYEIIILFTHRNVTPIGLCHTESDALVSRYASLFVAPLFTHGGFKTPE